MVSTIHEPNEAFVKLDDSEAASIRVALEGIEYDPGGGVEYLSTLRKAVYSRFPDRLIRLLEALKESSGSHAPYLVVDNLPIDGNITGSPSFHETGATFKAGVLSENLLSAIGAVIAEPYSIYHEGRELINNLTPHLHTARDYTGLGSLVELDFHTENAAQAHMPYGDTSPIALILLGIRQQAGDGEPETHLSDARKALALLDDSDIRYLRERHFIIRVPYRWRGTASGPQDNTELCSIVSGPAEAPRVTVAFYPDMVLPVNQNARTALDHFYQAVKSVSVGVKITPGRLVYINNRFALHSRDRFSPTFDENGRANRWVQRIFLASNLWNYRVFDRTLARVFDPSCLGRDDTRPGQHTSVAA
ncbi:TauD/TfdA family dioxygenase [Burkholderia sp. Bp9004]|uniref:TauD/TfdA family dioxygenase n=1 Tax=Burkholderia sp. Bp9004 TaxID=2184559 RepID=UPI000F5FD274|nr:TauD/TfdA family dioxygenase [Burkholderia sp. Bp9004]RQZ59999.1 oxygenase [Burkholderia sp. Bp9004]